MSHSLTTLECQNFSTNLPFYTADSNIDSMSATGRTEIPIVSYFCWPVVRTVEVHNIYEIISTNIMPRSHHLRKKKQENHKNFTLFRLNFGPIENTTFSFVMVFRIQSMVSWVFSFSFSFSFFFFFFHSYFIPTHEANWLIVYSFIQLAYLAIAIQCSRKDLLACSVIQFKPFLTKLFCGQNLYIETEVKIVFFFFHLFSLFLKFSFVFLIRTICRSIRLAYILWKKIINHRGNSSKNWI